MKCPVDNETLVIAERSGVEIDYCPKCRGVWLDRGELDKILERAAPESSGPSEYESREDRSPPPRDRHGHTPYRKKKRESFLSELFDF